MADPIAEFLAVVGAEEISQFAATQPCSSQISQVGNTQVSQDWGDLLSTVPAPEDCLDTQVYFPQQTQIDKEFVPTQIDKEFVLQTQESDDQRAAHRAGRYAPVPGAQLGGRDAVVRHAGHLVADLESVPDNRRGAAPRAPQVEAWGSCRSRARSPANLPGR